MQTWMNAGMRAFKVTKWLDLGYGDVPSEERWRRHLGIRSRCGGLVRADAGSKHSEFVRERNTLHIAQRPHSTQRCTATGWKLPTNAAGGRSWIFVIVHAGKHNPAASLIRGAGVGRMPTT